VRLGFSLAGPELCAQRGVEPDETLMVLDVAPAMMR
jgi:hypothetical protein